MNSLKLIALYFYVCEVYDTELRHHCQRFSPNDSPEFTDEELITIYLFAIMEEQRYQIKSIWNYASRYLSDWFPKLPSYQAFDARLNRLASIFPYLLSHILADLPESEQLNKEISLIDSFPIMLCSHKRKAKVARELSNKGYCATKGQHYFGLKLHVIGFSQPRSLPQPEYVSISPASWNDLSAMKEILEKMHDRTIVGDKIYLDKQLNERLDSQQSAYIYTPVKLIKGQSEWERKWNQAADGLFSTAVSRIRQPIESLFNWFIEKVDLQRASKVRSTKGLIVHVFGRLSAAFAGLLFNP